MTTGCVSLLQVIELLTSKESLMLSVKIDQARNTPARRSFAGPSLMGMFTNPPDTFELQANEFDVDAEITPNIQLDYKDAFMLKAKDEEETKAKDEKKTSVVHDRLSVLEMEADPVKGMPSLGMGDTFGFGPALALPTLQAFMPLDQQAPPTNQMDETGQNMQSLGRQTNGDTSLISVPALQSPAGGQKSPQQAEEALRRGSAQIDMDHFADAPTSISSIFTPGKHKEGDDSSTLAPMGEEATQGEALSTGNHGNKPSVDLSSFQIPSDSDDENESGAAGTLVHPTSAVGPVKEGFTEQKKQVLPSAMKKASTSAVSMLKSEIHPQCIVPYSTRCHEQRVIIQ